MAAEKEKKPSPVLFETQSEIIIGDEFVDPVYGHLEHDGYPVLLRRERERVIEEKGITLKDLETNFGIRGLVRQLHIEFFMPVKEGDRVTLVTSATLPRPFMLEFQHAMKTGDQVNAQASCLYVITNLSNRPVRIPLPLLGMLK